MLNAMFSPERQQRRYATPGQSASFGQAPIQQLFNAFQNRQPEVKGMAGSMGDGESDYNTPLHANFGGYTIQPFGSLGGGNGSNPNMFAVYNTKQEGEKMGNTPFDVYNRNGQFVGTHQWHPNVDKSNGVIDGLDSFFDVAIPLVTSAFIGGGAAGAFAGGAGSAAGSGSSLATGGGGFGSAGQIFGGGTSSLGGAGYGLGTSLGGGSGLGGAVASGAGMGAGGLGYAGLGSSLLSGASNGGFLSNLFGNKMNLGNLIKTGVGQIFQGGGGSSGGGQGQGGIGLGNIIDMIGGGVDASRQGAAADAMRQWLQANQTKMEGYMQPGSPEWQQMWEAMSRKDAAAGRNSQYGPRTSDFLANVAKEKAANIRDFTTGNSRALSSALNQNAAKYAGLQAALQRAMRQNGQTPINLSSILNNIGTGNQEISNDEFFDMVGPEGMPIDYGAGMPDPTEQDVWDSMMDSDWDYWSM